MPQLGYRAPEDPVPTRLSDLIGQLESIKDQYGDLEVLYRDMTWTDGEGIVYRLYQANALHEVIDADDRLIKYTTIASSAKPGQRFIIFDTNGV